ncbi:MAG TPA: PAS domain-containing protein, partial [Aggregicoccus sp.]|nr:PAS domain-containing protein [Aggregicoccus sp.]
VEDNLLEAQRTVALLGNAYAVHHFPEAASMLERLSHEPPPELLLLDWQLPGVSGLEACRFVREQHDEVALPVLMLTVRGAREDIREGLMAGANDYVSKPYDDVALLARVHTLVRGSRAVVEARGAQRTAEDALREVRDAHAALERVHTELQTARAELERERSQLSEIVEYAPAIVATVQGPDHVFQRVNPLYQRTIAGGRPLLGLPVREALPEVVAQGFVHVLDDVYRTGQRYVGQEVALRLDRHGDGQLEDTFFTFVYQPRRDARGRVEGIAVFGFEVTEQVRARHEAEAARAELEAIFQSLPDAVYVGDRTGIQRANAPALRMLGYDSVAQLQRAIGTLAQEIQTRRADTGEFISPEDQAFSRALRGQPDVQEVRVRHLKTGEERVLRCAAAPIRVGDAVVGAVAINTDITDRKAAELERERLVKALAGERAQLLAVLESAPVAVIIVDNDARVILANRRSETELGQSLPLIRSRDDYPSWTMERPDGTPIALEDYPLRRGLRGLSASGEEVHYRFADGTRGIMEMAYAPVRDAQGHIIASVVIFSNITQRKRDEAVLRERAAFERQLIGIVSHDLRNPIAAISMSAATLLRRPELDERQRRPVARILTAAERAQRMIRDLLDVTQARLGAGPTLHRTPVDLTALLPQVVDEVLLAHPGRRVERVMEGDAQGLWDADRLAQLVGNLLGNALTYSPPDSLVRVTLQSMPDEVVLAVHNEGEPIPTELQQRLFQP